MALEESRDDILRMIRKLPSDWWQSVTSADALRDWFRRNIVGLLLAGFIDSQFQYSVYTGFLLRYKEHVLWLTAGHITEEIATALASNSFKLTKFCWLDDYHVSGANAVIVHRKDMHMRSWKDDGLDFGIIVPSILDAGNLFSNPDVEVVDETIWRNLAQANPEGYYAIGYPRPWTKHSSRRVSTKKMLHSVEVNLAILPLREITPPEKLSENESWSNEEAFYGKILPYTDYPEFEVDEIKGMSGGPILSVERDPDGRIRYRLVGIIQSWYRSESIVRAEPISKISQAIISWLG